jgi:hypothetical protein
MIQNDTTALHFVVTCLSTIIIMTIIPYVMCIMSYVIIIEVHIIITIPRLTAIMQCALYDMCQNGTTALHFAAKEGHQDVVKLLLEKGYDINAKSNVRWAIICAYYICIMYILMVQIVLLWIAMLYCVLYCIVLHCIALYCFVLHCIVLYSSVLYSIVLYYIVSKCCNIHILQFKAVK